MTDTTVRICISDGHWGDEAAKTIADYWINREVPFPTSKHQALRAVRQIEQDLFSRTGRLRMDPDKDRPPEASFVAVELGRQVLRIISYGDCRLAVARFANEMTRPYYRHTELASWLGAFSMLGLRDRVSTRIGTDYRQLPVKAGDTIIAYSDGLDECIYETPTISVDEIMQQASTDTPKSAAASLVQLALDRGGEDNVSIAILRVT